MDYIGYIFIFSRINHLCTILCIVIVIDIAREQQRLRVGASRADRPVMIRLLQNILTFSTFF